MQSTPGYKLVRLRHGAHSVHAVAEDETNHPNVGPAVEAEALYVRQLRLPERARREPAEFVFWDVGLGAAANALTAIRALREAPCGVRVLSFDHTLEPLRFALEHQTALGYLDGDNDLLQQLMADRRAALLAGPQRVCWEVHLGDFPTLLRQPAAEQFPKPHAILFDPYSPAKNPAMWTLPLFARLFALLDPQRPCALATYSRSTMVRVTCLLAGFYAGFGHTTGEKEETTIAANDPALLERLLDHRWLLRASRSRSAEPLHGPVYRQTHLTPDSWRKLQQHPQFQEPR